MKKLTVGFLIAASLIASGCGSRSSSKSGARMKRPLNAATASDVSAADGNESECPANIEGKFEGQSDAGSKLVLEISRNSEAKLQVSMTAEGAAPVVLNVDGQEHSTDDGSTTTKLSCSNNSIVSVGTVNGVEFSGTYTATETGVDIQQSSPETKTRSFRKI